MSGARLIIGCRRHHVGVRRRFAGGLLSQQPSLGTSPNPAVASRGGQANEAGSLYRNGVAAYLATHGLAGRGVEAAGYAEKGPAPVRLAFETGEAVDDIRCELSNGTVLRVQAKLECGNNRHLAATVAQWAGEVHSLRPGDMVGLATGQPKGPVRELGRALDRRRRSVPGSHPAGERAALAAPRRRFPAGTPDEVADRVLQSAFVMVVAASSPREEGFRSVANLLDGTVVAPGSGSAAIEALQRAFQEQAALGAGSEVGDWLRVLAHLTVSPDDAGTTGPGRRAGLGAATAQRGIRRRHPGAVVRRAPN